MVVGYHHFRKPPYSHGSDPVSHWMHRKKSAFRKPKNEWFTSSVYRTEVAIATRSNWPLILEIRIVACPSLNLPFWFELEAEIATQNSKPNPQNLGDSIIISELIMFCSLWRHDFVTQAHMTWIEQPCRYCITSFKGSGIIKKGRVSWD